MDLGSLWKLNAFLGDIKESVRKNEANVFYYEIFVKRNDGLEWILEKRYSQFR
jgi:hypothetical protein